MMIPLACMICLAIYENRSRDVRSPSWRSSLKILSAPLLCDHIQEWDRPRIDSLKLRHFVISALHKPRPMSLDRNTIVRYLKTDPIWNIESKRIEP